MEYFSEFTSQIVYVELLPSDRLKLFPERAQFSLILELLNLLFILFFEQVFDTNFALSVFHPLESLFLVGLELRNQTDWIGMFLKILVFSFETLHQGPVFLQHSLFINLHLATAHEAPIRNLFFFFPVFYLNDAIVVEPMGSDFVHNSPHVELEFLFMFRTTVGASLL